MKKWMLSFVAVGALMSLVACGNSNNGSPKTKDSTENKKAGTSQSSEKTNDVKYNEQGADLVDYYNIDYKVPEGIESIVGYYQDPYHPEYVLQIFPDGRFKKLVDPEISGKNHVDKIKYYFDANGDVKENPYSGTYADLETGRVVKKDNVYFLATFDIYHGTPDHPLSYYGDYTLDENGNPVYLLDIPEKHKFLQENIKDILSKPDDITEPSFIKDGAYYKTPTTSTSDAWVKATPSKDLSQILEAKTQYSYMANGGYPAKQLPISTLKKLYTYTIQKDGIKPSPLSSDKLDSIKIDDGKLTLGYMYGENLDKGFATDGKSLYTLTSDQLGIHATHFYTVQ